jgi:hypothetical protein
MRIGTHKKLTATFADSGPTLPVLFRKSGSVRTSAITLAWPVATTVPVMPSPNAKRLRSMSPLAMPTAASVRILPVLSSSRTKAARFIFSLSATLCIIFANESSKFTDEERTSPARWRVASQ